jgi:hypothetical protein
MARSQDRGRSFTKMRAPPAAEAEGRSRPATSWGGTHSWKIADYFTNVRVIWRTDSRSSATT